MLLMKALCTVLSYLGKLKQTSGRVCSIRANTKRLSAVWKFILTHVLSGDVLTVLIMTEPNSVKVTWFNANVCGCSARLSLEGQSIQDGSLGLLHFD